MKTHLRHGSTAKKWQQKRTRKKQKDDKTEPKKNPTKNGWNRVGAAASFRQRKERRICTDTHWKQNDCGAAEDFTVDDEGQSMLVKWKEKEEQCEESGYRGTHGRRCAWFARMECRERGWWSRPFIGEQLWTYHKEVGTAEFLKIQNTLSSLLKWKGWGEQWNMRSPITSATTRQPMRSVKYVISFPYLLHKFTPYCLLLLY